MKVIKATSMNIGQLKTVKHVAIMEFKTYRCPCCGGIMSGHECCRICHWICDPVQLADHDLSEGRNALSLHEARAAFKKAKGHS